MNLYVDENIVIDYLSFTIPWTFDSPHRRAKNLGLGESVDLGYGGMGYKESATLLGSGRMYWNAERKDMGIHFRLGSSALSQADKSPLDIMSRVKDVDGKITRIDIAFDDFSGLLDIDLMYKKLIAGEVVTRFRSVTRIEGAVLGSNEKNGLTVNIGSRVSESFVRIYDKLAEQLARGEKPVGIDSWVRVELELKGYKANAFSDLMEDADTREDHFTCGELCSNLLFGLVDFKEKDQSDENKSRWETCDWWVSFVGASSKLRVSKPKRQRTLASVKTWIRSQVATSLAVIVLSEDDDYGMTGYDFIIDCIVDGEARMTIAQKKLTGAKDPEPNGE